MLDATTNRPCSSSARNSSHCRVPSPQKPRIYGPSTQISTDEWSTWSKFEPSFTYIPVPNDVSNVGIITTPEVESLDANIEASIWVAVDVEGKIDYSVPCDEKALPGLDVLIVIDNSCVIPSGDAERELNKAGIRCPPKAFSKHTK